MAYRLTHDHRIAYQRERCIAIITTRSVEVGQVEFSDIQKEITIDPADAIEIRDALIADGIIEAC